mmetsp:Transcript_13845/g.18749  ORF Transcript_13845/g.18749 Transcript_13845/m.18749 type:complete len:236 (-) Transcript_13845:300-1007(-)
MPPIQNFTALIFPTATAGELDFASTGLYLPSSEPLAARSAIHVLSPMREETTYCERHFLGMTPFWKQFMSSRRALVTLTSPNSSDLTSLISLVMYLIMFFPFVTSLAMYRSIGSAEASEVCSGDTSGRLLSLGNIFSHRSTMSKRYLLPPPSMDSSSSVAESPAEPYKIDRLVSIFCAMIIFNWPSAVTGKPIHEGGFESGKALIHASNAGLPRLSGSEINGFPSWSAANTALDE